MPTALTTFIPQVTLRIPVAPDVVILDALRTSAINFCRNTQVIKEFVPDVAVVAGTATYAVPSSSPSTLSVVGFDTVWLDNTELDPITPDELTEEAGSYWPVLTGKPTLFIQDSEGTLVLYRKPEAAGVLNARAALAPTRDATVVPDVLAGEWRDAIVAGALNVLYSNTSAGWFDAAAATAAAAVFSGFAEDAKAKAQRGHTRARRRVKLHTY